MIDLAIIGFVAAALGFIARAVYRICAPVTPRTAEENYWRFIPNWKPERIQRLHVVDPEEEELARKACETLLKQDRDRRREC